LLELVGNIRKGGFGPLESTEQFHQYISGMASEIPKGRAFTIN